MGCGFGLYGGSPWIGLLFGGIRIAIFVAIIVMSFKFFKNYKNKNDHQNSLRDLDEMFVRGDLTEEEYRLKKKIILE